MLWTPQTAPPSKRKQARVQISSLVFSPRCIKLPTAKESALRSTAGAEPPLKGWLTRTGVSITRLLKLPLQGYQLRSIAHKKVMHPCGVCITERSLTPKTGLQLTVAGTLAFSPPQDHVQSWQTNQTQGQCGRFRYHVARCVVVVALRLVLVLRLRLRLSLRLSLDLQLGLLVHQSGREVDGLGAGLLTVLGLIPVAAPITGAAAAPAAASTQERFPSPIAAATTQSPEWKGSAAAEAAEGAAQP